MRNPKVNVADKIVRQNRKSLEKKKKKFIENVDEKFYVEDKFFTYMKHDKTS